MRITGKIILVLTTHTISSEEWTCRQCHEQWLYDRSVQQRFYLETFIQNHNTFQSSNENWLPKLSFDLHV